MQRYLLIATLAVSAPALAADPINSMKAAQEALATAGYTEVRDVELDDGLWEAEVRGDDGKFRDVHIVPATGTILDAQLGGPIRTAEEIMSLLESKGFNNIRELDLDDAVWEADATAPDGASVELRINGFDGEILATEHDD